MPDYRLTEIDERLSKVGLSLDAIAKQVCQDSVIGEYPVNLISLLNLRRILSFKIDPEILSSAVIEMNDNYFELKTQKALNLTDEKDRFVLAHEIAHTYQFSLEQKKIKDTLNFETGTREQEYFANYIARAILIPDHGLKTVLGEHFEKFSLKSINTMMITFLVNEKLIIQRLFYDTRYIPNCVIFRFRKFSRSKNWKLLESYLPDRLRFNKKYYVASISANHDKMFFHERLPHTSEDLSYFLDHLFHDLEDQKEKQIRITSESLRTKPLDKFFRHFNHLLDVNVTRKNSLKYKTKTINLLIKLPQY